MQCNIWGQCGITPEFCTVTPSSTGAPGTTGCVSNCGSGISAVIKSPDPPAQFVKVGYYEAFNPDRPCLTMTADQIPTGYSHVHFSFAGIGSDLAVKLAPGSTTTQFLLFIKQSGYKKILAFGGWSFSTNTDSTPIFRASYTDADRLKFAQNIATVVNGFGLDGVDFDWEYPGAPDQAGAGPSDGANYLSFLKSVRQLLPNKSISIAAPASYYYLRGFPIAAMAPLLDYIVFMTYDLHGQWDFGKTTAQSGCPAGNCLRSHVNLTETIDTLAMITKAGVPSNKIAVGLASYGRSFRMADPSCTGPMCRYTSRGADPGVCTGTSGYIAQAELEATQPAGTTVAWRDAASLTDIMTYGNGSWVAYLNEQNKATRIQLFKQLRFGGSAEWAIDLASFVPQPASSSSVNTSARTSTTSASTSTTSASTSTTSVPTSATSTAKATSTFKA